MDLEPFEYVIDWGRAPLESLSWIAIAWVISALVTLVILYLIGKFTVWGSQFWQITGDYFTGPGAWKQWLWLAAILLSVVASVRIQVLLSYYYNDLGSSLQTAFQGVAAGNEQVRQSGIDGFWTTMIHFAAIAGLFIARLLLDLFMLQRFQVAWRAWLTDKLTTDWLDRRAYYRTRFIDDTIDNPDQRIQADIDVFTTGQGPQTNLPVYWSEYTLLFGAINAILSIVSFTAILWNLSGTLTIPFTDIDFPRALFWIGIVYVLAATVVAFWIGRPIVRLTFDNEKFNAAFRYSLVRLRESAESVAFYRGERAERVQLRKRFDPIVANYKRYINRSLKFNGWNWSMGQLIVPLPYILQAPRLFAGEIKYGDVAQTSNAFSEMQAGLSFFRNSYDMFAGYRAAIIRLHGLVTANERGRELPTLTVADSKDDVVSFEDIEVRTPDGSSLIEALNVELETGDALVIVGTSGSGKTTLLRSLAELWPYTTGVLRRPGPENATMFLSQLPYVPLGDLRAVVSYPAAAGDIPDDRLESMLDTVVLGHLSSRLDEVQDWAKVLSPGEQQRIAFARVLLTKPKAAFLDEATSALDEGMEFTLYQLVRQQLPETILVSVSHRKAVEQHHTKVLELLGAGPWRLGPLGEDDGRPTLEKTLT
ncbi:MAG: ABC transporter ATP-binding protein/permease [Mycobacterium sp.]